MAKQAASSRVAPVLQPVYLSRAPFDESKRSQVESSLYSFVKAPYGYLVETFIPAAIRKAFADMGLSVTACERRLNLPRDSCVHYDKTQLHQWYVRFPWAGEERVKKVIEVPVVDEYGVATINGLRKIFVNKLRRRNVYASREEGLARLTLVNLRNKRVTLQVVSEGEIRLSLVSEGVSCRLEEYLASRVGLKGALSLLFKEVSDLAPSRARGVRSFTMGDETLHAWSPRYP